MYDKQRTGPFKNGGMEMDHAASSDRDLRYDALSTALEPLIASAEQYLDLAVCRRRQRGCARAVRDPVLLLFGTVPLFRLQADPRDVYGGDFHSGDLYHDPAVSADEGSASA